MICRYTVHTLPGYYIDALNFWQNADIENETSTGYFTCHHTS